MRAESQVASPATSGGTVLHLLQERAARTPKQDAATHKRFGKWVHVDWETILGDARRVAVLASGGLSHTKIDLDIDATFIEAIQLNDRETMEAMRDEDLVDGTSEIRCWVVAETAADRPAKVLAYEPLPRVPEGNGVGMGVAEW